MLCVKEGKDGYRWNEGKERKRRERGGQRREQLWLKKV